MEEFIPFVDESFVKREKARAKELKKTPWWKKKKSSGICHYCGKKFPPDELTMDHIIPVIRGGKSVKENLVPSCRDCNSKKKYHIPTEVDFFKSKESEPLLDNNLEPG